MSIILKPIEKLFNAVKRLILWSLDYTGPLAEIVKLIPVLLIATLVLSPWLSYPLWMHLALSVGTPLCYAVFAVWLGQWALVFIGAITVAHIRENR